MTTVFDWGDAYFLATSQSNNLVGLVITIATDSIF